MDVVRTLGGSDWPQQTNSYVGTAVVTTTSCELLTEAHRFIMAMDIADTPMRNMRGGDRSGSLVNRVESFKLRLMFSAIVLSVTRWTFMVAKKELLGKQSSCAWVPDDPHEREQFGRLSCLIPAGSTGSLCVLNTITPLVSSSLNAVQFDLVPVGRKASQF